KPVEPRAVDCSYDGCPVFGAELNGVGDCCDNLVRDDDCTVGLHVKPVELGRADFFGEDVDVLAKRVARESGLGGIFDGAQLVLDIGRAGQVVDIPDEELFDFAGIDGAAQLVRPAFESIGQGVEVRREQPRKGRVEIGGLV